MEPDLPPPTTTMMEPDLPPPPPTEQHREQAQPAAPPAVMEPDMPPPPGIVEPNMPPPAELQVPDYAAKSPTDAGADTFDIETGSSGTVQLTVCGKRMSSGALKQLVVGG